MLLLDTHALLWLDSGAPMTRESSSASSACPVSA
jgi:PIN domain nuclease of toxin-antitoxin system